jgi:hypothetical protein
MFRKLLDRFKRSKPEVEAQDPEELMYERPESFYRLGPITATDLPLGPEDTYSAITLTHEQPKANLTPPWKDFPAWMLFFQKDRPKPWRLLLFDPDSRQYVIAKEYLTEVEADQAASCLNHEWPLEAVIKPN